MHCRAALIRGHTSFSWMLKISDIPLKSTHRGSFNANVYMSMFFCDFLIARQLCDCLLDSLDNEALPNMGLHSKERILSRSNVFPFRVEPHSEYKNEIC